MFTGIVEEVGEVLAVEHTGEDARLRLRGEVVTQGVRLGDSIAVSGVCLTVTSLGDDATFTADVMPETLRRSTLGTLAPGSRVNLERAVRADGRLDGHLVQGHVDGVGALVSRTPGPRWDDLVLRLPAGLARYVAEKGSIAVSGVSLTVTHVGEDTFGVSLIPTTLAATTLGDLTPGDPVNLEVDVVAKYVERLLGARPTADDEGGRA
ncbi:riboflavin synthase subunit alpha [Actinotalea ferrariae CF5-4]|uniref:Riboflavin synthase n=1 Tax=Actinotalea ferrariae CF5-4 TaxID=948458 RepID=A0A021VQ59_9CELL|nr:riboflavin synthase [Actinotalea ferrariae]EYR63248.1 riboflavin synthase subunit alpha [Actinotalea ferrariae CF5-4]